jgi:hypothetical protein
MNNFRSRDLAIKQLFLTALSVMGLVATAPGAQAEYTTWTVNVKTEELPGQFVYRGSTLSPVAKVRVTYSKDGNSKEPKQYENLWYHNGKPIGLERLGTLEVNPGDLLSMEVTHKKHSTEQECKAAANTVMKFAIQAFHNGNPLNTIRVPSESFAPICNELVAHNCFEMTQEADQSYLDKVRFVIDSYPDGVRRRLYFQKQK